MRPATSRRRSPIRRALQTRSSMRGPSRIAPELARDPAEQASSDFIAIDLVEHFVSTSRVEVVAHIGEARLPIPLDQEPDALESLADGIVAAREHVDGDVAPDPAQSGRIGEPR